MTDDKWFYTALDIKHELANRVESLGFEHVRILHEFRAMTDSMEYNIYFCSNEGRQRITVVQEADSIDVDGLMRQFQDQLLSKSEN